MEHAVTPKRTVRAALGALASAAVLAALLIGAGSAQAAEPGSISGTVTAANGGAAIQGVQVCAFRAGVSLKCDPETDVSGQYQIAQLEPDEYAVIFYPPAEGEYLLQLYNGAESFEDADPVSVVAGEDTPEIDAALVKGARIEGTVTDAQTGVGISEATACAFGFCATTGPDGSYAIVGLPKGEYNVEFKADGYEDQFWNGKRNELEADWVAVEVEQTVTGINASLSKPPVPPAETPPAESQPPALFPTVSAPTITPPKRKRCRRGFRRKRVHGHYRCVKKHRRHRKRRRHRHHR